MRGRRIIGILFVILGAVVLIGGGRFTTRREVLKVGDVSLSATERRSVPAWAGALAIGVGVILVLSALRRPG
jgi:hypothetical protein